MRVSNARQILPAAHTAKALALLDRQQAILFSEAPSGGAKRGLIHGRGGKP